MLNMNPHHPPSSSVYHVSFLEHENRRLLHIVNVLQQENFELVQSQQTLQDEVQMLRAYLQTRVPEPHVNKSESKLLASIPDPLTTNPTAALINFCNHFLKTELDFRHELDVQNHHTVTVWLQNQPISTFTDLRKKRAREQAAKQAIQYLNEHPQFVLQFRPEKIN